jgi:hypothetical protein
MQKSLTVLFFLQVIYFNGYGYIFQEFFFHELTKPFPGSDIKLIKDSVGMCVLCRCRGLVGVFGWGVCVHVKEREG